MKQNSPDAFARIQSLFDSRRFCVLSTQKDGQPYASLVGFAVTRDVKELVFLTPRTTRKFENLAANPKVALLVDNSGNQAGDFTDAIAVTATGVASVPEGNKKDALLSLFLQRHPHLEDFSREQTTALICVRINRYILVSRFQDVIDLTLEG